MDNEDSRAGFPQLPRLPIETDIPPSDDKDRIADWNRYSAEAAAIAQKTGLIYDEIHVTMLKGQDETFHPTILISIPNTMQRPIWRSTLQAISKTLNGPRHQDIHVLITEPVDKTKEDHAYTIASDHPIVKLWPKISKDALEILKTTDFLELCVWKWGITEEVAMPTVVIVVEDKQKCDCEFLIKSISRICKDHGASDLKVAITEGRHY